MKIIKTSKVDGSIDEYLLDAYETVLRELGNHLNAAMRRIDRVCNNIYVIEAQLALCVNRTARIEERINYVERELERRLRGYETYRTRKMKS